MDLDAYTAALAAWDRATDVLATLSAAALPGEEVTALGLACATAHKRLDAAFARETLPYRLLTSEVPHAT